jgi:omega-hydroxy-beta-dihydromenaquinone-9 sulfotransferase
MADKKKQGSFTENPLAGGSFSNWIDLARENSPIEAKFWVRAAYVTAMTAVWSPLRLMQRSKYGARIDATEIKEGPLFILGHYRSGTTFLQNLIVQDQQWGCVSTTQAVLPEMFLLGPVVMKLLGLFLPDQRPMDNVEMAPDLPEEPEHAVGAMSEYCFYHGFCFPKRMMHYFRRYVLFADDDPAVVEGWKAVYLKVIKAATLGMGGRRLMVKNPADTARVPQLLELFPDAKFIYLYRDPFVMFPSIKNFYTANIRDWRFQDIPDDELDENIFTIYTEMIDSYHRDKHLIPKGALVELKFEDFEKSPLQELSRIYAELSLPNFDDAKPAFEKYIESKSGYKKNKYVLDPDLKQKIAERWRDDIERGGYGAR